MPNSVIPNQSGHGVNISRLQQFLSPNLNENDDIELIKELYLSEEFNSYINDLKLNGLSDIFSCMHVNCRSIFKNGDSLLSLLNILDLTFCAIGVSETWLKHDDIPFNISGYDFIGNSREAKRGGGVGIFIRNDYNFIHRKDLDVNNDCIESVFIEFNAFHKRTVFGTIYRPPGQSIPSFLGILNVILESVNKENKDVFLVGDFNIDLMNSFSSALVNEFLDILMINSMYPLIHFPTRTTQNTSSLLDNIFTNKLEHVLSGVLVADISDHLPIFSICRKEEKENQSYSFEKRDLRGRKYR